MTDMDIEMNQHVEQSSEGTMVSGRSTTDASALKTVEVAQQCGVESMDSTGSVPVTEVFKRPVALPPRRKKSSLTSPPSPDRFWSTYVASKDDTFVRIVGNVIAPDRVDLSPGSRALRKASVSPSKFPSGCGHLVPSGWDGSDVRTFSRSLDQCRLKKRYLLSGAGIWDLPSRSLTSSPGRVGFGAAALPGPSPAVNAEQQNISKRPTCGAAPKQPNWATHSGVAQATTSHQKATAGQTVGSLEQYSQSSIFKVPLSRQTTRIPVSRPPRLTSRRASPPFTLVPDYRGQFGWVTEPAEKIVRSPRTENELVQRSLLTSPEGYPKPPKFILRAKRGPSKRKAGEAFDGTGQDSPMSSPS